MSDEAFSLLGHYAHVGLISDPTMPKDEISFRQDGKEIGRIVGLHVTESLPPSANACPKCGKELAFGEFPFCGGKNNHGFPIMGGLAIQDDQITGGARYFENLGHEPVWIETKSQLRAELSARGLMNRVEHKGKPGSDRSSQTQRFV